MMKSKLKSLKLFSMVILAITIVTTIVGCQPQETSVTEVILATTTSTQDSGLLDKLIPIFEEETGYKVKTVAVGTGAALALGKEGEADVLLTHAPASEEEIVESGHAVNRQLVMHNDFIICGPESDPAGIKGQTSAAVAYAQIAENQSTFVSRGDDSGTHKKELEIWKTAEIEPDGSWYVEAGAGMGDTLAIASEKEAYVFTDRGTYLALKDTLDLEVLVEKDLILLNIYHVMQVNPEKFEKVNADGAQAFVEFMISEEVQDIIADFGVDKFGEPLFVPDAGKSEPN